MESPQQDESAGKSRGGGGSSPSLINSIVTVGRDFASLLFNRIELAALELGEVRGALVNILLVGALAMVAIWFAVAYWTVLLVYFAWDMLGWKILAIVGLVFTVLAWFLLRRVRSMVDEGRLSMPATMAELRHDRDALLP